jgi:gliding motility-associatede transport system auxiliary component
MAIRTLSKKYVKFLTYLIVVILINIAGLTLFFRIDLTANKAYSLSEVSRKVVSTLSEPLTVKVFFTKNLPAPYNNNKRFLNDLLEEYGVYANRYFNYHFYEVSPEEGDLSPQAKENRELARNYGIPPVQIQVVDKDEVKFQKAYMGLVLIHGDIIEKIPAITSTDHLEYQLTTAIQKLNNKVSALLALPDKIRIKLFLSSSLEAVAPFLELKDLSELPKKLEEVVKKLNEKTYGRLKFEYLDPTKDPNLESLAQKYNLLTLNWPALSQGRISPGHGTIGLVMEYEEKSEEIPLIRILRLPLLGTRYEMVNLNDMEELINSHLESLVDINENLGYLSDHGTFNLISSYGPLGGQQGEGLSNFQSLVSQTYSLKRITLDKPIPDSLNCLVIARPTESFSDYELYQIDQYLMQGKSLAIFLDAFKTERPSGYGQGPTVMPLSTGLEKLLAHYGIRIGKSYILDENCYKQQVPAQYGGGEHPIYFAPEIRSQQINHDLPFMKNINDLVALKISPLELDADRIAKNGLKASRLFSSSEKSWEMSGAIDLNPLTLQPPPGARGEKSQPLAYVLEGRFPSYFAGKPIPVKTADDQQAKDPSKTTSKSKKQTTAGEKTGHDFSKIQGEGQFLAKGKPGKIFLIASSTMVQDSLLDDQGTTPNAVFILNVLDFLNKRVGMAALRSKDQSFNPLAKTGSQTKTLVKSFNMAGLPLLVAVFGLFVWSRRRSRKKRIQKMFQNKVNV